MFQAGADMSDTSGDEDETVPARVGQAAGRTDDSEVDNDEGNNFFRVSWNLFYNGKNALNFQFQRAAPVYPKNMINHNLDGAATTGMRRTTSSIA